MATSLTELVIVKLLIAVCSPDETRCSSSAPRVPRHTSPFPATDRKARPALKGAFVGPQEVACFRPSSPSGPRRHLWQQLALGLMTCGVSSGAIRSCRFVAESDECHQHSPWRTYEASWLYRLQMGSPYIGCQRRKSETGDCGKSSVSVLRIFRGVNKDMVKLRWETSTDMHGTVRRSAVLRALIKTGLGNL